MHEQLAEFPENVSDLPEHIFNDAYTDDIPPNTVVINGINTVAESIPLRSNSKLLKTQKSTVTARVDVRDSFLKAKQEQQLQRECSHSPIDAHNDDPDELALYVEYKQKLRTLRASQASQHRVYPESVVSQEFEQSPREHPALAIHRAPNGSLVASAAAPSPPFTPVKAEATACSPGVAASEHVAGTPLEALPNFHDLDPYTMAAVTALQQRDAKKKKTKLKTKQLKRKKQPRCLYAQPRVVVHTRRRRLNVTLSLRSI